ncbi:Pyridoxamine 5'-phosphate oxidase family protein [Rhodovastum atsumiense]|uniref:Pyridoxamine 5'-phosphate oxidase family protein n=1 Tax=Rhodovastum atsumiense TaxID=504468 RepID=A0A5M6IM63_9PROT|nr:pyridoxamine 5'-phosphate oxidase family protein [Rhodovastum atsumiense]KAA5609037.1 pyridoxamine 5'-phosphate oxidase family protein [Rhodovastum atsumiense]CAH2604675.1 Pyridoxamine 5'-phosphate oxidase family protein [Rhodovastum atsumiense]
MPTDHVIRDEAALAALYGAPVPASIAKEVDHLHPLYQEFVRAAPFVALATSGRDGLDVSPRGDGPGFVAIGDPHTLLLPDRPGNNRIDSLRNILADSRVALLFLIPGVNETLRVNGRAEISVDPDLLARFEVGGKPPRSVLVVRVETVFFQCARALMRASLWDASRHVARTALPSNGTILAALSAGRVGGEEYDRSAPARLAKGLY